MAVAWRLSRPVAEITSMDPRDLATMIQLQQQHDEARARAARR